MITTNLIILILLLNNNFGICQECAKIDYYFNITSNFKNYQMVKRKSRQFLNDSVYIDKYFYMSSSDNIISIDTFMYYNNNIYKISTDTIKIIPNLIDQNYVLNILSNRFIFKDSIVSENNTVLYIFDVEKYEGFRDENRIYFDKYMGIVKHLEVYQNDIVVYDLKMLKCIGCTDYYKYFLRENFNYLYVFEENSSFIKRFFKCIKCE